MSSISSTARPVNIPNSLEVKYQEIKKQFRDIDYKRIWDSAITNVFIPIVAAGTSIIPVYIGFARKSNKQLGETPVRLNPETYFQFLKKGMRAAPTIGAIVGTQIAAQKAMEMGSAHLFQEEQISSPKFSQMLASSAMVGFISAPCLAIFNGQTMNQTYKESLRGLCRYQIGAIVARESSFLLSIRVSDPLGAVMKTRLGDSKPVEYGSAFVSGVIGSIIGHPADTALTLWQKGKKIDGLRSLMKGVPDKAIAVGLFSMCYKLTKEIVSQVEKERIQQLAFDSLNKLSKLELDSKYL